MALTFTAVECAPYSDVLQYVLPADAAVVMGIMVSPSQPLLCNENTALTAVLANHSTGQTWTLQFWREDTQPRWLHAFTKQPLGTAHAKYTLQLVSDTQGFHVPCPAVRVVCIYVPFCHAPAKLRMLIADADPRAWCVAVTDTQFCDEDTDRIGDPQAFALMDTYLGADYCFS